MEVVIFYLWLFGRIELLSSTANVEMSYLKEIQCGEDDVEMFT